MSDDSKTPHHATYLLDSPLLLPPFLHTTYRQRRSKVKISKVSLIGKIFGKEVMWEMPRWLWCIWRKCRPKFWSIEQLLVAACLDHSLWVTVAYRQDFSSLFRGSGYFAWYYAKEYRTLLFATDFHIRHTSKTRMKFDSQVCSKYVCMHTGGIADCILWHLHIEQ